MAGIYLHIPFCKQACHYCNFHFSTSLKYKEDMLSAMLREIELQKDYLKGEKLETVYLGGGTPSLLDAHEIERLFESLTSHFSLLASRFSILASHLSLVTCHLSQAQSASSECYAAARCERHGHAHGATFLAHLLRGSGWR